MVSSSLIALLSSSYILLSSSPLIVVDAFGVTNTHPLRNLHNSHIGNRRHGQWGSALPPPTLNLNLSPSFLPTIGDNPNAKRTSGSSLAMADSNEVCNLFSPLSVFLLVQSNFHTFMSFALNVTIIREKTHLHLPPQRPPSSSSPLSPLLPRLSPPPRHSLPLPRRPVPFVRVTQLGCW